eukprot:m.341540 g.341540  ORF g.341540 m.341540 type:complete len:101 (+) comp20172_c0_seq1:282-584(+)
MSSARRPRGARPRGRGPRPGGSRLQAPVRTLFMSDGDVGESETTGLPPIDLNNLALEAMKDTDMLRGTQKGLVTTIQKDLRKLLEELPLDEWRFEKGNPF